MSKILTGICLTLMFWSTAALADMIEVKRGGIMNGKVLSENDKEVRFKDAKGKEHIYKRAEVLFLEKDAPGKAVKQQTSKVLEAIKQAPEAIKKGSAKLTEKYIAPLSQPLDRSSADAKSAALNSALEEANRAAASGTGKMMTFNREVYRQQNEAKAVASTAPKKGRFASLED